MRTNLAGSAGAAGEAMDTIHMRGTLCGGLYSCADESPLGAAGGIARSTKDTGAAAQAATASAAERAQRVSIAVGAATETKGAMAFLIGQAAAASRTKVRQQEREQQRLHQEGCVQQECVEQAATGSTAPGGAASDEPLASSAPPQHDTLSAPQMPPQQQTPPPSPPCPLPEDGAKIIVEAGDVMEITVEAGDVMEITVEAGSVEAGSVEAGSVEAPPLCADAVVELRQSDLRSGPNDEGRDEHLPHMEALPVGDKLQGVTPWGDPLECWEEGTASGHHRKAWSCRTEPPAAVSAHMRARSPLLPPGTASPAAAAAASPPTDDGACAVHDDLDGNEASRLQARVYPACVHRI